MKEGCRERRRKMMVRERRTREGRGMLRERETKRGEWECGETVREMELEVGRERERTVGILRDGGR